MAIKNSKEKLKISLFSPFNIVYSAYSLRLLYNSLIERGFSAKVYYYPQNFYIPYDNKTLEMISSFLIDSDVIGISLYTNHFSNVLLLTQYLKNKKPDILIIWGGVHPIIRPEECIKYADIICVGEAEESFPELCECLVTGQHITDVKGFWFSNKDKSQIIRNERVLVSNLDKIPYALYSDDDLVINNYNLTGLLNIDIPYYTTLATRGCPYSCTYCINDFYHNIYSRKIRQRSVGNVIEELKIVKSRYKSVKNIWIDDDAFIVLSNEYIKEFSERYKREIGIPLYISGITPKTISKEKLGYLKSAGLNSIRIGFQTGSERILDLYDRKYRQEDMLKAMEIASDLGLSTELDIITDNPWEDESDVIQTIKLLDKCKKSFYLNIFKLTFYPGTYLYERAKKEGMINNEIEEIYNVYFHTYQKNILNRTLELISIRARYYLNLPRIMTYMINKGIYNTLIYSFLLVFYTLTTKKFGIIHIHYHMSRIIISQYGICELFKRILRLIQHKISKYI